MQAMRQTRLLSKDTSATAWRPVGSPYSHPSQPNQGVTAGMLTDSSQRSLGRPRSRRLPATALRMFSQRSQRHSQWCASACLCEFVVHTLALLANPACAACAGDQTAQRGIQCNSSGHRRCDTPAAAYRHRPGVAGPPEEVDGDSRCTSGSLTMLNTAKTRRSAVNKVLHQRCFVILVAG